MEGPFRSRNRAQIEIKTFQCGKKNRYTHARRRGDHRRPKIKSSHPMQLFFVQFLGKAELQSKKKKKIQR